MKRKERAEVIAISMLTPEICSLTLSVSFAGEILAGQFVSLFPNAKEHLLPRPISVCEADAGTGRIRLVFRIAGDGTREFSRLSPGSEVDVMGPLGNGFPIDEAVGKRVLLIGGGIGIPPILFCAHALKGKASLQIAAGYRSAMTFLLDELKAFAPVMLSSDDGTIGVKGTVLDAVRAGEEDADVIFACGPKVMLRAVKEYAEQQGIPCFVSMEERMACGVGACLGCVCKTAKTDSHSMVKNARVCTEGPVFPAEEVDLT